MSGYVVDASVAVKWLVIEELSQEAKDFAASAGPLVAPRLILTEVANALSRKVTSGLLTVTEARRQRIALPDFLSDIVDVEDLIDEAFKNAIAFKHPIYDFIYLEIARNRDAQLVTADSRFHLKIGKGPFSKHVVLLSDWRSA